jgi:hypothetical protein
MISPPEDPAAIPVTCGVRVVDDGEKQERWDRMWAWLLAPLLTDTDSRDGEPD